MKPTLLILAAGMGSRYGGLKQLDAMGPSGEVVLDYSVFDAIRAGFGKVVFVIRRDFEELFRTQIGSKYAGRIEVNSPCRRAEQSPGARRTRCWPPRVW
jgi:CTP:molybdopterin cytidylyltransferase MocA